MGIRTHVSRNPAMVLGGLKQGVTPLEMAKSYETLAEKGNVVSGSLAPYKAGPVTFTRVEGGEHRRQERGQAQARGPGGRRRSRRRRSCRRVVSSGTGRAAQIGEFAAGKTGTTENYQDAWFVGFDDDLTVAVWVGYPEGAKPMETEYRGEPVAGGTFPAEIWHDFMVTANKIRAGARAEGRQGRDRADRPRRGPGAPVPARRDRRADRAREVQAQEARQAKPPKDGSKPERRLRPSPTPEPEPGTHADAGSHAADRRRWRRRSAEPAAPAGRAAASRKVASHRDHRGG